MNRTNVTYRPLGEFIKLVDERNKDLKVKNLQGLSIEKKFIPSIANTIGTDMSTYRVVKPRQFAYGPVTSRNGDKVTVALYKGEESAIISQAYLVFEITDFNQLLPEYLMMWFLRPEFDRYARFHSHGSAREIFDWDELCATQIPVPPIEEQHHIVEQYNAVQRRIDIQTKLITKLQDTAQALYKKTFVDGIDKDHLPDGWRMGTLGEVTDCFDYKRKPLAGFERDSVKKIYPYYGAACLMDYIDNYLFDGRFVLMGEDGSVLTNDNTPVLQYVSGKFWVNNHAHVLRGKNGFDENLLYVVLSKTVIADYVTGGVQAKLNQANMNLIPILIPDENSLEKIKKELKPIFDYWFTANCELQKLNILQTIILSKTGKQRN